MVATQQVTFNQSIFLDRMNYDSMEDLFSSWYQLQTNKSFHSLQQANDSEVTDDILMKSKIALSKDKKYFTNI